MAKKPVSDAASALGKRSAVARKKQWGAAEFKKRMQEWGKLGGRPKGSTKAQQAQQRGKLGGKTTQKNTRKEKE